MTWNDRLDKLIDYAKWPAALMATLSLPLLVWSAVKLVLRLLQNPSWSLVPFALGITAFVILWRRLLGRWALGRWLLTLEHEITHALFALLTLHKIVSIRATLGQGGEVRYHGKGNWLITAAPYFFPTAALLLSVLAFVLPFSGLPWPSFLLGVALAYHLVSTYRETHHNQSDLKELGSLFCWMFLPAANVAMIAFLIAYAHDGSNGVRLWLHDVAEPIENMIAHLRENLPTAN